MSQQLSDPDAFLQPLSQHRERLKDLMQAILGEITKTGRRNARLIESSSAQIDLQVRQFEQLNQHLHTTRIAQEAQAASQADLMQLRREWGAVLARFNNTRLEMRKNKFAHVCGRSTMSKVLSEDFTETGVCNFFTAKQDMVAITLAMAFQVKLYLAKNKRKRPH